MFSFRNGLPVFVLALCSFSAFSQVQAATTFTNAGVGSNIVEPANWDNGVPDNSGNSGTVPSGMTTSNTGVEDLDSRNITFAGSSSLISTSAGVKSENSTLTFQASSAWVQLGAIALGRGQIDENILTNPGADPEGDTILNISGSATVIAQGDVKLARGQNAFINQTGGVFSTGNGFGSGADKDGLELGKDSKGGVGTYTLSGGSVFALGQTGLLMENGSLFTISSGEVNATNLKIDNSKGGGTVDFTAGSTGSLTIYQDSFDFGGLVAADNITINGVNGTGGTTIGDFTVDDSISGQTTLSLPGVTLADKLVLTVDTASGVAAITYPHASPIAIDYYEVRGIKGALISDFANDFNFDGAVNSNDLTTWADAYGGSADGADFLSWQRESGASGDWQSLDDRDFEGAGTWVEGADNSTYFVSESRTSGSTSIANGVDVDLSKLPAPGAGSNGSQLIFRYHVAGDPAGDLTVGNVSYTPAPLSAVTAVPEPSACALLATCSLALGATRSRRRSK